MKNIILRHIFYLDKKLVDDFYFQVNENIKSIKTCEDKKNIVGIGASLSSKIKKIFGYEINFNGNIERETIVEKVSEISRDEKIDFLVSIANGEEEKSLYETIKTLGNDNVSLVVGKISLFEKTKEKDFFNIRLMNTGSMKIIMKASKSKCLDDFTESTLPPEYYQHVLGLFYKYKTYYKIKPIVWYNTMK